MLQLFQTAIRNIRLFFLVVVGVPLLIFAGIMTVREWWSGDGTLHVHASPGESVMLSIDGAPPEVIHPGQHFQRELPQGAHRVAVSGPLGQSSFDVDVTSGMWRQLVPTSAQQCWVELDAYPFYYAPSRAMPTVEARYPASAPIAVGMSAYYDDTALPSSVSEHSSVELMQPIPCNMMSVPDDQLLYGLGFQL